MTAWRFTRAYQQPASELPQSELLARVWTVVGKLARGLLKSWHSVHVCAAERMHGNMHVAGAIAPPALPRRIRSVAWVTLHELQSGKGARSVRGGSACMQVVESAERLQRWHRRRLLSVWKH